MNNNNEEETVEQFSMAEIDVALKKCPNGKAPGIDGVKYEDIKSHWEEYGHDISKIFNIVLVNRRIPTAWKHATIQRTPKKNFNRGDLSTLRDISLLPTLYKVFSRCLCNRLMPFVTNEISFWQRAYLNKRERQDLI